MQKNSGNHQFGREKLPHPFYCPDLAPSDFHSVQRFLCWRNMKACFLMKKYCKERRLYWKIKQKFFSSVKCELIFAKFTLFIGWTFYIYIYIYIYNCLPRCLAALFCNNLSRKVYIYIYIYIYIYTHTYIHMTLPGQ